MKRWLKHLSSITLTLSSCERLCASTTGPGLITGVLVSQTQGRAYIVQNTSRTTPPACATNQNWVFSTTTAQGQALLSTVLTNYNTGKPVIVSGTGNCVDVNGYETIDYLGF